MVSPITRHTRMRYVLAGVIGVAAASVACGLVIDADELVADVGNAPDEDAPSGDDRVVPSSETGAKDSGADTAPSEGGPPITIGCRPPPTGSIAACVPAPPAGAELLAVVWGKSGTPIACPSGYQATAALTGYADIEKAPPPCSPTGCTCSRNGTPTCGAIMQYYSDALCKTPTTSAAIDTRCERSEQSGQPFSSPVFPLITAGVTCASGGASSTTVDKATLCTTMQGCRKDPTAVLPSCSGGNVAAPPATNARACYRATGACTAPYVAVAPFSTQQQVSDTRACGCACSLGDAGCTGGTASVFGNDNSCAGGATTTLAPGCRANSTYDRSVKVATPATLAAGAATCAPSSDLTGALTLPPSDIQLCCLPE
jgi:hypothetical protein